MKFIVEYIIRKDLWGLKMGMFIAESVSDEILRKSRDTRLIALDLDGTTLTREGLSRRTKDTLETAISNGIDVVIATGRVFSALPERIHKIKGMKRIITSNGAHITDAKTGTFIYSNYADEHAIMRVHDVLSKEKYPVEVFTEGRAYIDRAVYDDLAKNGSTYMSPKYVLRTRTPVDGIYDFLEEHRHKIENINIHFEFFDEKDAMFETLSQLPGITVTSSFSHNLEIGGATTSKATALREICLESGVAMENVMAFGDSPNDSSMISEAGVGIAMVNATEDVKAAADCITLSNNEEGVAYAIRKLIFGKL